jgi:DNA primase
MIRCFRLGLANRTLGYRLPKKNRKAGAELRSRLQKLGILRSSGHEHFNGSLVIPVLDSEGMVSTLYGRKIGERLRTGTPMHLYLPGAERAVWNLEALASSKEVILCESLIDALSFWVNGFRSVTTSYGTNGFSPSHLEAFEAYGINRVLLAYDRDAAGEKAAKKHAALLMERGIGCYRVLFPKGMDANEYAVKVLPAQQSLDLVLRKAVWMGQEEGSSLRTSESAARVEVPAAREREAPVKQVQAQAAKEERQAASSPPPTVPRSEPERATSKAASLLASSLVASPSVPPVPSQSLSSDQPGRSLIRFDRFGLRSHPTTPCDCSHQSRGGWIVRAS